MFLYRTYIIPTDEVDMQFSSDGISSILFHPRAEEYSYVPGRHSHRNPKRR